MAGFDHKHVEPEAPECAVTSARNSRIGLVLFLVYLAFYGGFVLMSAFRPDLAEATPLAGVNVAILYGFALIVVALAMSLLYGWLCRLPVDMSSSAGSGSAAAGRKEPRR